MAPWKRTRQTHADARLSALPSHPAQTRRVLNGHSIRKSRSENIWTVFNGQPFYKSAQLERSGAELLFHPHKVSLCYTNCWRDWDERLEWLNYNKHFLNVWSAFKSRTTHRLTLFWSERVVRGEPKFRRRSSPRPQRCGSPARLLPWYLPIDREHRR